MLLFGVYVLSEDPVVLTVPDSFLPSLTPLLPPGLSPWLMVFPTWTYERFTKPVLARWRLRHSDRRKMFWMCTTPREARFLGSVGYSAAWCHQNLFCDEEIFRPTPSEKKFDAVYTAQIKEFKRLELASKIPSLRLLTATEGKNAELLRYKVAHAVTNERYLSKKEMADALAECQVGLALSAEEGGMLACTEYLLSGIPVVTTPSIGGRDVWLDSSNSITVPPTSDAVARAVRRFVSESPDPQIVQRETIKRLKFFRAVLSELVRHKTGQQPFDPSEVNGAWFVSRFVPIHFLGEFLNSYNGSGFDRADLMGKRA